MSDVLYLSLSPHIKTPYSYLEPGRFRRIIFLNDYTTAIYIPEEITQAHLFSLTISQFVASYNDLDSVTTEDMLIQSKELPDMKRLHVPDPFDARPSVKKESQIIIDGKKYNRWEPVKPYIPPSMVVDICPSFQFVKVYMEHICYSRDIAEQIECQNTSHFVIPGYGHIDVAVNGRLLYSESKSSDSLIGREDILNHSSKAYVCQMPACLEKRIQGDMVKMMCK